MVRPKDGDTHPMWIGRALSNSNSSPENPNCVLIQYFCPTSRNQDVIDFYIGWDRERGLCWKVDEIEPPVWQHTNAFMTAWKFRIKKDIEKCMIKIPNIRIEVINQSLTLFN